MAGESVGTGTSQNTSQSPDEFAQSLPATPLSEYKWQGPAGWTEQPASSFVTAAYTKEANDKQIKLTLSRLAGRGGNMSANISRWRQQIGLAPVSEVEMMAMLNNPESIQIAGGLGLLFSMENPDNQKKTSVVIVPRRNETWYIKLTGDLDMVTDNQNAITEFSLSVQMK